MTARQRHYWKKEMRKNYRKHIRREVEIKSVFMSHVVYIVTCNAKV